jgi:hypothetical protein
MRGSISPIPVSPSSGTWNCARDLHSVPLTNCFYQMTFKKRFVRNWLERHLLKEILWGSGWKKEVDGWKSIDGWRTNRNWATGFLPRTYRAPGFPLTLHLPSPRTPFTLDIHHVLSLVPETCQVIIYRAAHICVHTRNLDVDFNILTGVADICLWTTLLDIPFSNWMLVVNFNGLNNRGGRLFIDSGARCGFLQTQLPWCSALYRLLRFG